MCYIKGKESPMPRDTDLITALLHRWADRTRRGRQNDILADHAPDAVIFDVLAPLRHMGTAAYRATWDEWQPETTGEATFQLEDLSVTAGSDVAFDFGLLRCGGTSPDGKAFAETVRATFCLTKAATGWRTTHQHISAPK
jgi:ketosteroid isomerase-like protein